MKEEIQTVTSFKSILPQRNRKVRIMVHEDILIKYLLTLLRTC